MPEEIRDVNPDESSQSEQVVEQADTTTANDVDQSQNQESSTQEVKPEVEKPDRPEINYAMEAARKASEALEEVRQLRQQQQTQQTQQPLNHSILKHNSVLLRNQPKTPHKRFGR
jgi:hypothetical protein